ncbi:MAG: glycosyltransferase, partial [Desulfuromonadaceae bacterium]|nr:glycosyltransferase [Desulfuromonadaceae bacterium]
MNKSANPKQSILAIVCPQIGAPSETFIRNHIELLLPGHTVVITSGVVDDSWVKCPYIIVPKTYGGASYHPDMESQIIEFISKHGVTHILCEFGSVGTGIVKLNQRLLHLPLFVHFFGQDSSEELRKQGMLSYYAWMGSQVPGVITVAKSMTARLQSIGVPSEKLHTNSCGVAIPGSFNNGVAGQPCRFLSVTRLVAKKGVFYLIKAFAKARRKVGGITLDIIGDGPLRPEIEKFIVENNLANLVFLHGTKPHAFVEEQLNHFSAYAQHSMTDPDTGNVEGLPVIILEAAAHGLPVISTFHEGIPEAVEHGITGLLANEGDVDAMAGHMVQLACNPQLRQEMGHRGRDKIAAEFAMDISLSNLRK